MDKWKERERAQEQQTGNEIDRGDNSDGTDRSNTSS